MKVNRKILFEMGILLFSLFYLFNSIKLEIGELSRPGPGFFPIALGLAGVAIAALLLAGSLLKQKKEGETKEWKDILVQNTCIDQYKWRLDI